MTQIMEADPQPIRSVYHSSHMLCDMLSCSSPLYLLTGQYQNAPTLEALAGTCSSTLKCSSSSDCEGLNLTAPCSFKGGGQMVSSDDPKGQQLLRQLIVQGPTGSNEEGGLEKAFQYFAEQERKGTFDANTPKEIVVIADEESDADGFLCPFNAVDRKTSGIPNFNPPTPTNTRQSCVQDLSNRQPALPVYSAILSTLPRLGQIICVRKGEQGPICGRWRSGKGASPQLTAVSCPSRA